MKNIVNKIIFDNLTLLVWIRWIGYLITFTLLEFILIPIFRKNPEFIHKAAEDLSKNIEFLIVFSFHFIICIIACMILSPNLYHLRFIRKHPPIWLGALFATLFATITDSIWGLSKEPNEIGVLQWLYHVWTPLVFIFLVYFFKHTNKLRPFKEPYSKPREFIYRQDNQDDIQQWLSSNDNSEVDYFGNFHYAERIANLIKADINSVGLVGPYGSGKSTIVNWIYDILTKRDDFKKNIIASKHSCWSFESSSLSIKSILKDSIKHIHLRADTFFLNSIPDLYRQTFLTGTDWIDRVTKLITHDGDIHDQFESLDKLLSAIGTKLVIIIEDLDRNDSKSFDIQEVQALLQQFNRYKKLLFILVGDSNKDKGIDFIKLCDHIELMQQLHLPDMLSRINSTRDLCMNHPQFNFTDVNTPPRSKIWHPATNHTEQPNQISKFHNIVSELISTPRLLQRTLTKTYNGWKVLHGEVDWDSLFLLNAIKICDHQLYIKIYKIISLLAAQSANIDDQKMALRLLLDDSFIGNSTDSRKAENLVMYLLPELFINGTHKFSEIIPMPYQSINKLKYWKRYTNEFIPNDEHRDQDTIRSLLEFHRADDQYLINKLVDDPEFCIYFQNLHKQLAIQLEVLESLIINLLTHVEKNKTKSNSHDMLHNLIAHLIFKLLFINNNNNNINELKKVLEKVYSIGLGYAYIIFDILNDQTDKFGFRLRHSTQLIQVKNTFLDVLKENIVDHVTLDKMLLDNSPILFKILFITLPQNNGIEEELSNLNWLGKLLLNGIEAQNHNMILEIGCICSYIYRNPSFTGYPRSNNPLSDILGTMPTTTSIEILKSNVWIISSFNHEFGSKFDELLEKLNGGTKT